MTPAIVLSLVAVCITGAGILVQLGRVLSRLDTVADGLAEIRGEQHRHRDSIETLRREAAVRDSSVEHLSDALGLHAGAIARAEERLARLDATPHHGLPRVPR